MLRKALIIANPGVPGNEDYCKGVLVDVSAYRDFLLSDVGGAWERQEIVVLRQPVRSELRRHLATLPSVGYGLVVFTGHAQYSTGAKDTLLGLRQNEEIALSDLRTTPFRAQRETIILDCCRKPAETGDLREIMVRAASTMPLVDRAECRRYYDDHVQKCQAWVSVLYACEVGELAGDDSQRGGYYSYALLAAARGWAEQKLNMIDLSKNFPILSIAQVHARAATAVMRRTRRDQNPQIEKPRSGPYFPFAVVA